MQSFNVLPNFIPRGSLALPDFPRLFKFRTQNGFQNRGSSLNSFDSNKSPRNDGLTVEFYKFFWNIAGELLVAGLNYSYDVGELSNSQKKAIIILLGKKR